MTARFTRLEPINMRTLSRIGCILTLALATPAWADDDREEVEEQRKSEEDQKRAEKEQKEAEEEQKRDAEEARREAEEAKKEAKREAEEAKREAKREAEEAKKEAERERKEDARRERDRAQEHVRKAADEAKRAADIIQKEVRENVDKILAEAKVQASKVLAESKDHAAKMIQEAEKQVQRILKEKQFKIFEGEDGEDVLRGRGPEDVRRREIEKPDGLPRERRPGEPRKVKPSPFQEGLEGGPPPAPGPRGRRFELDLDRGPRGPLPDPAVIEDLRREVRDLGREIERIESLIEDLHRTLGERRDPGRKGPPEEGVKRVRKVIEGPEPREAPLPPKPPVPVPPPPGEREV